MKKESGFAQSLRLAVICVFTAIAFVAGLSLTFIKSNETKAQIHDDISTAALIRSQNDQHSQEARSFAQTVAYKALLQALSLSPYDAMLWVHFAHVLSLQPEGAAHKPQEALEIAVRIAPDLREKLEANRSNFQEPKIDER